MPHQRRFSALVMAACLPRSLGLLGSLAHRQRGRRLSATVKGATDIFGEVAAAPEIQTLVSVLELQGLEAVELRARKALHPLVIPLAKAPADVAGDRLAPGDVVGVLRWASPEAGKPLPVVRTRAGDAGVELLSTSSALYASRAAIEAVAGEAANADELVAAASAADLVAAWESDARKDPILFTMLRVGAFPDLYRHQARKFVGAGSTESALVACERANDLFKGWGMTYAFFADVLSTLPHRKIEARDAARIALRMPIWTLGGGLGSDFEANVVKVAELADYTGTEALRLMYAKLADDEKQEQVEGGRLPQQIALDRAAFFMDAVACGWGADEGGWASDPVRGKLANLYREADRDDFADFIEDAD